jgi:uncharacterized protein (DUF58 family)
MRNDMQWSIQPAFERDRVTRTDATQHAVHVDLLDLLKLEFTATGFSFLPRQPVHSLLAGRRASRLRGRGLNFEEIRRYLPGDDVRNMDWRVTARTGKPHVRAYSEERDRPCLLIVDQRQSMFFGSRRVMKSVAAAEVAALAAWRIFHAGDRVGALVFNDTEIVTVPPLRSRQRVMDILGTIRTFNHALKPVGRTGAPPEAAMLPQVFDRVLQLAKHDYLVCLISDGAGYDMACKDKVAQVLGHNDFLAAFIYDPLEAALPDISRRLVMSMAAQQMEIDLADRRLRQGYAADFQTRLTALTETARQRSIPLLPITTDEEVAPQIRRLLGAAGHPASSRTLSRRTVR